ncbi:MAG: STAS/SEC14 domain-containing protein, partial [Verrucomicrobiota bacterium]
LAVVGEKKWQEGMATFCKPFTKATVKYFDHADAADARVRDKKVTEFGFLSN